MLADILIMAVVVAGLFCLRAYNKGWDWSQV